jgi:Trypsin-like peptidase domain/Bacterial SH3 domain
MWFAYRGCRKGNLVSQLACVFAFHVAVLCACALATDASAQQSPAMFGREQFGQITLSVKQSTGGATARILESLGAKTDRFEPINRLRGDDPFRLLGRAVGRLDMREANGTSVCTATLIDRDKIITNAHCIPGKGGVDAAQFVLGYLDSSETGAERFKVDLDIVESNRTLDYTILRVAGEPGAKYGFAKRQFREAKEAESLFMIHHPGGQPQRLTRAFCRALPGVAITGNSVRHQCDTLGGSSGSLIFAQTDGAIVGLHHSGGLDPGDATSYNKGTNVVALTKISAVLQQLGPSGGPSAVAPTTAAPPPPKASPALASGQGPSFPCTGDLSKIETLICGNADLAAQDRAVMASLRTLLAVLPANERTTWLSTQREWFAKLKDQYPTASRISVEYTLRKEEIALKYTDVTNRSMTSASDGVGAGGPTQSAKSKPAAAPAGPRDIRSVLPNVSDGLLNLRTSPSAQSKLVAEIPAGSGGIIVESCQRKGEPGQKYPWCRVTWKGQSGWVSSGGLTSR